MNEKEKKLSRFSEALRLVELAKRGLAPSEKDAWAFVAACHEMSVEEFDRMNALLRRGGLEYVDVLWEAKNRYLMIGKATVALEAMDLHNSWWVEGSLPDPCE